MTLGWEWVEENHKWLHVNCVKKEERDGVEMICFLQKCAGIIEPLERALESWRAFTDADRDATRRAYKVMGGDKSI